MQGRRNRVTRFYATGRGYESSYRGRNGVTMLPEDARRSVHVRQPDGQAEGLRKSATDESAGSDSGSGRHKAGHNSVENGRKTVGGGGIHGRDGENIRDSGNGSSEKSGVSEDSSGRSEGPKQQSPADTPRLRTPPKDTRVDDKEFLELAGDTPETKKKKDEARKKEQERLKRLSRAELRAEKTRTRFRNSVRFVWGLILSIPELFIDIVKFATMVAVTWSLWRALLAAMTENWLAVILHLAVVVGCVVVNERI